MRSFLLRAALAAALVAPLGARPADDDAERKKLEAEIAKELGATPGASAPAPSAPAPAAATPENAPAEGARGGNPLARLVLLPDISAIGSAAAAWNSQDVGTLSPRGGPFAPKEKLQFEFQELELGLQAVVDPYLRADVFIAFGNGGVDVEEAYVTTLGLPAGFQVKAGKLFSPFGRLNQQHPHTWDFVDAPLARTRLLADENLGGAGASASWLVPVPWFLEVTAAAQSTAPAAGNPERLTGVGRLATWVPFAESTTLGLGLSAARRDEGSPGAFRDLAGVDAYLRYRPVHSRAYATLSAELYARRLRGSSEDAGADRRADHGYWVQAFWRQDPWWGYGARYEEAPSAARGLPGTERRGTALVTWFASEFQRIRLQGSYDRLPGGRDGLEALLQLEFGIGAHGAHPF